MDVMTFLMWVLLGALGVSLVPPMVQGIYEYRKRHTQPPLPALISHRQVAEGVPSPTSPNLPVKVEVGQPPSLREPDERASWYWRQLLSPRGVFGGLVLPVELLFLILNSFLIALSCEVLFGDPGPPLFMLVIGGWERAITLYDLIGVLVSLGQMLAASACLLELPGRGVLVRTASVVALVSLLAFEIGLAYERGHSLDGTHNAYLSALMATGAAGVEVFAGVFVIDYFLLPLGLAVLWTGSTPAWSLWEWWERRKARPRFSSASKRRGNPLLLALAWPFAMLHEGPLAILRDLDTTVRQLFTRKNTSPQGGKNNAATSDVSPDLGQEPRATHNGHVPGRIPVPDNPDFPPITANHLGGGARHDLNA